MQLKFTKDGFLKQLKAIFLYVVNFFSTPMDNLPCLSKCHFSLLTGTKVLFLLFYYQN